MGATNPRESAPGTIRGDFGVLLTENLVHGSDGPESAAPGDRHLLPRAGGDRSTATPRDVPPTDRVGSAHHRPRARRGEPHACEQPVDAGPRHGRRPRHREHPRVRARPRHRAQRAVGRGRQRPRRARRRRRPRGQAHDRAHAEPHPGHPAAEGRRHRRLRGLREDAPLLHPQGAPQPLRQAPHGHLRAVGHHRRRAAGRAGGRRVRRRPQARLHHRGAHGRGHRRRPARCRSPPAT